MLLIHQTDVSDAKLSVEGSAASLINTRRGTSKNYLFAFLLINHLSADTGVTLIINNKQRVFYRILNKATREVAELSASDNMYLITPDRFANGLPGNDNLPGYYDALNRNLPKGRHGGDIQGIIDHLDYIHDLGFSSIWINPLLENNQKEASYHGYAATDLYKIDPRFGTLSDYQNLSTQCSEKGMGLIMDIVYNHIGSEHLWMNDLPVENWVNRHDTFTNSNYRAVALADPHASDYDKQKLADGWFVPTMPDLNQRDPLLAIYLVQNTLWWIETAQLQGLRVDTYAYPDNDFMKHLVERVKREFPNCFILGEIWEIGDVSQAWFSPHLMQNVGQQGADGVTDYQLYFSIMKWMQEEEGWSEGLGRIYYALAADLLYAQPNHLVTFLDNHDQDRFWDKTGNSLPKWKQGIGFLLTTRGIPCIYYGTELLFPGSGDHGVLRKDFDGGWLGDTTDKFDPAQRTSRESDAFQYLRTLLSYRNNNKAVFHGELTHFVPENGIYVYFRKDDAASKHLMVIISNSENIREICLDRFAEILPANQTVTDIMTGKSYPIQQIMSIAPGSITFLEF